MRTREILRIKPNFEYEKLPPKFKAKWIEALTSGRYDQATGALVKENEGFCCLGVAANVCEIGINHLFGKASLRGSSHINDSTLPENLRKRIPVALRDNFNLQDELATFNDFNSATFSQIAAWIDKYL